MKPRVSFGLICKLEKTQSQDALHPPPPHTLELQNINCTLLDSLCFQHGRCVGWEPCGTESSGCNYDESWWPPSSLDLSVPWQSPSLSVSTQLEPGPNSSRFNSSSFIFPVFINLLLSNCLHIPLPFSRIFPAEENQHTNPPLWLNVGRCLVKFYKTYIKQFNWKPVVTSYLIFMSYLHWRGFVIFTLCLSLTSFLLS